MQETCEGSWQVARKKQPDFDPAVGAVDHDEEVRVYVDADRRAIALPSSIRRMTGERLEIVREMQELARDAEGIRGRLDELVPEARGLGVSWAAIGFSVGLTGEAARLRWSEDA